MSFRTSAILLQKSRLKILKMHRTSESPNTDCSKYNPEISNAVELLLPRKNPDDYSVTVSSNKTDRNSQRSGPDLATQKYGWRRFIGICLSLVSCITLSLMALIAKVLKPYHPSTLTFWRYMGSTVPAIPIILWFVL